jgi:uncharacterized phiE125 gp8 family phage protein
MSAYITVAELAEYLGIAESDDDGLLAELIKGASAMIEKETGRVFVASADTTRYFDLDAITGKRIFFDADLCAVTTVTNGDSTVVSASQYVPNPRNVTPWYAFELKPAATVGWDGLTGEIAILGRWAYSTTPDDTIKQATKRLAGWYYRQRDNASEADRAIVAGNATILPSKVPADVAAMLKPYKVTV